FKKDNGYHVVPPPLTRNYMPPLANLSFAGLDDSIYRPTANKTSASVSQVEKSASQISNTNVEMPRVEFVRPILTRSGRVPVSAAKQSSFRAAASTSVVKQVNTATHTNRVNVSKLRTNAFHKSNSPIRRPFYKLTVPHTRISNEKVNTVRVNGVNTAGQTAVSAVKGNGVTAVKASAGCVWRPKMTDLNNVSKDNSGSWVSKRGNPQQALKNKGIFDSGCSRHMTGNKDFLTDYQDIDGGFVAFGGSARGGKITGKGKIRTDKLDFEDVFFVKELKFNLFSVSQMCDKKNSVLFTETECLVLSPDFKLLDASQVLLRVPRQSNMYIFDLKNVVPSRDLTCLFSKSTIDESKLWHRRLVHVNFKTMNKLVKGNLVRGLPSKIFENDQTCVACQKGKQHKASCQAKTMSSISQPLQMLHMDLFGPTSVRSINHKTYCLVVPDDFSRTLIEAAMTMLADSLQPTVFWTKAVNTACYVLNRVLVTKPHNKTPYELIIGRPPSISFMRPFGCPVTIINTLDPLGKFDGKSKEGFLVGYFINSKAFRGIKLTKMQVPQEANGDTGLKKSVNDRQSEEKNVSTQQYIVFPLWSSISSRYKSSDESYKNDIVDDATSETPVQKPASKNEQALKNVLDKMIDQEKEASEQSDAVRKEFKAQCNRHNLLGKTTRASNTNNFNTVSTPVNAAGAPRTSNDAGPSFVPLGGSFPNDFLMPDLEDTAEVQNTSIFCSAYDDDDLDTYNSPYADQVIMLISIYTVQPKVSHLNAVKRIFRYLKGRPKLGLWYPKDSPFILEAFSDSDYAGASLDRKSTTGGCQFLGSRLISWQCKKQTVVANSTTEAEYIAASHCCGQVLWIQNQMLDYGYNFMQTKIHVDNESAICVVKNPVYHSKTKHIEIRHHFIRDSYEKRLIEMVKIHTDNNVADLFTKAFDGRLMVYKCNGLYTSAIWIEVGRTRKTQTHRRTKKDTKLPQTSVPQDLEADEAVHKDGVTGMDTCGSPRRQDTMGGVPAQTWSERVLENPNELPLLEGHTSGSREGRMEHQFELTGTVPITPHDLPLLGGYTPGSDEDKGCSSYGDPQAKEKSQEIRKTKEVEHLTTKKKEIQDKMQAVLESNPGSTCHLETKDRDDDGKITFKRMYICFKGIKQGWLDACRKVIRLDGCFLTYTCKGQLLTAIEDLELGYGGGLTLIFDGHKGATSCTVDQHFLLKMEQIKELDPAAHKWIVPAKGKPIITMLEDIRIYIMQRMCHMNNLSFKLEDTVTPSVRKRLELLKDKQRS
ncbi:ribonuclease H-like domain-containing protein, partial [Tanacetum coccineum]